MLELLAVISAISDSRKSTNWNNICECIQDSAIFLVAIVITSESFPDSLPDS